MMGFHIIALSTICLLCWVILSRQSPARDGRPRWIEAKAFLAVILLYTVPLPLAVVLENQGGDLSEDLIEFTPWLPAAIWFTAAFAITFTLFFCYFNRGRDKSELKFLAPKEQLRFKIVWIVFLLVCIILLELLAKDVGGLLALILSGYRVTELFVGNGELAIAFEWLVALSVILMSYGVASKKIKTIRLSVVFIVFLITILFIMGRRGMLVMILLSIIYIMLEAGFIKSLGKIILPGLLIFVGMNWLGLVRGESYTDLQGLATILIKKTEDLSDSGELLTGLFYTLTHGNFVVPFETLPQIIHNISTTQEYWLGLSLPRSVLMLVPSAIFPDRPLPLANWYMSEFYGNGFALNEGRQFFFLSEAYLNFGWIGFLVWGILIAWLFAMMSRPKKGGVTYLNLSMRALFFGSLLNFTASDTSGFLVAFAKGYGLVLLVFLIFAREKKRS